MWNIGRPNTIEVEPGNKAGLDQLLMRIPKGQSINDNPEKLVKQGTQDEDKQNKNSTQYVLDTTMCKQTQIM